MKQWLFEQNLTGISKAFALALLSGFIATVTVSCSNDKDVLVTEIGVSPVASPAANPSTAKEYYAQGQYKHIQGDTQGAIAAYTKAITIDDKYVQAYNGRGLVQFDTGDRQGAIADYNEALRISPDNAQAYNNRGNARAAQGDREGAVSDYDEAIRLNPNFGAAYNNRGNARVESGDKDAGLADLQRAAEIFQEQNNQQLYNQVMENVKEAQ